MLGARGRSDLATLLLRSGVGGGTQTLEQARTAIHVRLNEGLLTEAYLEVSTVLSLGVQRSSDCLAAGLGTPSFLPNVCLSTTCAVLCHKHCALLDRSYAGQRQ